MKAIEIAFLSMSLICPAYSFSHQHNTRANPLSPRNVKSTAVEMVTGDGTSPSKITPLVVALTREEGKNDKLRRALLSDETLSSSRFSVEIHEIPCIEHADGPDTEMLVPTLTSKQFDYIAITSPEAAKVIASAWVDAGRPDLGVVAAVGKATGEALKEYGIDVGFVPSKATAETLVNELPLSDAAKNEMRATTLLYPASAKARDTLQNGLEERGFSVSRLNTYDTVPATWTAEQLSLAESAQVACFASPSAVKAWLKNTASIDTPRAIAACIGETSATACIKNEWEESNIFYPEKPGVDGWASAVVKAIYFIDQQC
ncbi:hypothetical protein ACHAWO_002956 [Cyclotella atomus]|jgi:uroporphyrinogen-III synthase|uniref:Uroporphyrinogen-III synthase n=1 Tax=Cyclotella atomus TaxID=382360 RepID=A0ABD3QQQ6_9STRA